ncbi:HEAT repeat domain-containing protein [Anabaena azotica]|uniref:HEAT repeat domain-containing protein n=1 Tax=Anabaena azotica TaxID=197653 RepID=UPI0039A4A9F7
MTQWNDYLESLCKDYAQWWNAYTLTDVVGKQRIEQKQSPLLLDFMVQTVQSAKEERNETQEKIERLDVLAGLRKYAQENVLLVGRPGSGKSTALVRLLLEEAERGRGAGVQGCRGGNSSSNVVDKGVDGLGKIPILVELRYYQTSVLDLIRNFLKRHCLLLETATIEQLLFNGQFLLLVDGINELPSEKARQDLYTFRQDYQKTTPMIFTTRDLGVGGDLGITKKLEMQSLTAEQMQQFVRAYLPQQGEQMLQKLGDRLREFGETPLLLWMLCSLFQATGDIPANLGLVFRQFTQSYNDKLKPDIPVTDESRRWWLSLLKHLAFYMTTGDKLTELNVAIPKSKAEDVLTQFLQAEKFDRPRDRALQWLQDLLNHHLIQLGANDQIEFRHQLIQEYYTAECLLKLLPSLNDECFRREYLNYLKWTEPLKLMLGLVDDEALAVRVVKLALEVDWQLGAKLAGAVKPELQQQTVNLVAELEIPLLFKIWLLGLTKSDKALPHLNSLLEHEDSDVRSNAASALGEIKSENAITALIHLLEDKNPDVRSRVASALGKIKSDVAVSGLIQLLKDEYSRVRLIVVTSLYILKSDVAIPGLIPLLEDEDESVRYFATYALVEIQSESAITELIKLLEHEKYDIRLNAAFHLENIKYEDAIPQIIELLKHEDSNVRSRATDALEKIKSEKAVPGLIQLLEHENPGVRYSAADALGKIKSDTAIPSLISLLEHENWNVSYNAASALGEIKSEVAVYRLIQLLEHENSGVRFSAAYALGKAKSAAAILRLIPLLEDKDSIVRSSTATALGDIKSEVAIPRLIRLLDDEHNSVRSRGALALGQLKSEMAIPGLIKLLEDIDPNVRSSAASALGDIKSEAAIPELSRLLEDKNSNVRSSAVFALNKIKPEVAIPGLVQLLGHENSHVQYNAESALKKIKSETAIPKFIQLLEHENSKVRYFAASVLGEIKSEAAVPKLIQLLEDDDSYVRFYGAYALGKIKSEAAVSKLIQLLEDDDWMVRTKAALALKEIKLDAASPQFMNLLKNHKFVSAHNGDMFRFVLEALEAIQINCRYYRCLTKLKNQPDISQFQPSKTSLMYILHLSDLHFGTPDQAKLWSNQLATDLQNELDIPHLDALILSGDIANKSTPEEYAAAQQFLHNLCQDFTLQSEQIIIVPGNHDLNWQVAKKAYQLIDRDEYEGELKLGEYIEESASVIRVREEEKYKQRFEHFCNFYQTIKQESYPQDYDQQYTLAHFPNHNLLILGLNSAWELDHHYKSRASINMNTLSNALTEIRRNQDYKNCLMKIAVWHHPLDSAWDDRIKDQSFMEQLAVAGFRFFLHGHVHQAQKSFYEYDAERGLFRICAGTFGAPTHELTTAEPWQYHLLKLENNTLTVRSRKRKTENGVWEADNCWRQGKGKGSEDFYQLSIDN